MNGEEEMNSKIIEANNYDLILLYETVRKAYKYTALLESMGEYDELKSRYSIIGIIAEEILYEKNDCFYRKEIASGRESECDLQSVLDEWCKIGRFGKDPFSLGAIGYIGYENNKIFEPVIDNSGKQSDVEKVFLVKYSLLYVSDRNGDNSRWIAREGTEFDNEIQRIIELYHARNVNNSLDFMVLGDTNYDFTKKQYINAVNKCISYIKRGDLLQANITMRFFGDYVGDAFVLYKKLRSSTPNPFFGFLDFDTVVISTSPESFLNISNGEIVSSPIKGTIRCEIDGQDQLEKLMNSEKDKSENVMIADLIRNDIGRISEIGTVSVPKLCEIKRFNQLYHLETVVKGKIKSETTLSQILRWNFPGGSITGAPKVKSMQVISELESVPRNIYCGTIGFFGENGYVNTNIAIRVIYFNGKKYWLHGGGAIVADSEAESEYDEMLLKVEGLIHTLDEFNVLKEDRKKLDEVTKKMLVLLGDRMDIVNDIMKKKKKYGISIEQKNRINNIKNTLKRFADDERLNIKKEQIDIFADCIIMLAMEYERDMMDNDEEK